MMPLSYTSSFEEDIYQLDIYWRNFYLLLNLVCHNHYTRLQQNEIITFYDCRYINLIYFLQPPSDSEFHVFEVLNKHRHNNLIQFLNLEFKCCYKMKLYTW